MALTAEGAALTEAHRLAQAKLSAETAGLAINAWTVLDLRNIEATIQQWLTTMEGIVATRYMTSAALARQYEALFRKYEIGPNAGPSDLVPVEALDLAELKGTLAVRGPGVYRDALNRGLNPTQASQHAQAAAARSSQRLVNEGGRRQLAGAGVGYQRVTSGAPCAFCMMLAGRGPVYHSQHSGGFKAHDGCHCSAEPVYRQEGRTKTPQEVEWGKQYDSAVAGLKSGSITTTGKNRSLNALRTHLRRNG